MAEGVGFEPTVASKEGFGVLIGRCYEKCYE